MIVLQINAVFGYGSTGRNVYELHTMLNSCGHTAYAAWATKNIVNDGDPKVFRIGTTLDHKHHAVMTRLTGKQGYFSRRATKRLCLRIDGINPDIVHLHNLHSNFIHLPTLFAYLAKKKIATVITLHDCWFFTGGCYHYSGIGCGKWRQQCVQCPAVKKISVSKLLNHPKGILADKAKLFSALDKLAVIGVSDWITNEARQSFLKDAAILTRIYNWIDTDIFRPVNAAGIKEHLNIGDKKVILGVSQGWSRQKGLEDMLAVARYFSGEAVVVLVGKMDTACPLPGNIIHISFTQDVHRLAALYTMADVFVNPSPRETFGKVTAEALACGTPAVVYANTGSKELVEEGCGYVVPDKDLDELMLKIAAILEQGKDKYSALCRISAERRFSMPMSLAEHVRLYKNLLDW